MVVLINSIGKRPRGLSGCFVNHILWPKGPGYPERVKAKLSLDFKMYWEFAGFTVQV